MAKSLSHDPVTITNLQKVTLTAKPVRDGAPAPLTEPPMWCANPKGTVSLTPSGDGLTCEVKGESPGVCNVTCQACGQDDYVVNIRVTVTIDPTLADAVTVDVGPPS